MIRKYLKKSLPLFLFVVTACSSTSTPTRGVNEAFSSSSAYQLGLDHLERGLFKEAKESFLEALKQNSNFGPARQKLGMTEVKLGQYASARSNLEKVISGYEKDFQTNFDLAEAYRGLSRYPEAIYRYNKALRITPGSLQVYKPLAWSYFQIQDYTEAHKLARSLYRRNNNDPQAALIFARILIKLHRQAAAASIIARAKKSSSEHSLAFFESVEGDLFRSQGKYKEAVDSYHAALKKQPLLAGALYGLGECMYLAKDYKKAVAYGERAYHLDPKMIEATYLLARSLETIRPKDSVKYYLKFMASAGSAPEFVDKIPEARVALSRLGFVKKGT